MTELNRFWSRVAHILFLATLAGVLVSNAAACPLGLGATGTSVPCPTHDDDTQKCPFFIHDAKSSHLPVLTSTSTARAAQQVAFVIASPVTSDEGVDAIDQGIYRVAASGPLFLKTHSLLI
ncbi:MAG: hypothetical protein ABL967_02440 [Bryobacteraceae bacterium]